MTVVAAIALLLYGAFWPISLVFFLSLSVAAYIEDVDDQIIEATPDFLDLIIFEVPRIFGRDRILFWLVISFLWPLALLLLVPIFLHAASHTHDSEDGWSHRILRWVFLGFGKYSPQQNKGLASSH